MLHSHCRSQIQIPSRIMRRRMEQVTFRKCAEGWLAVAGATVKPQSLEHYRTNLRIHILPAFGNRKIERIKRGAIKEFLACKLNDGLKPKTVGHLQSTIYGVFQHGIDMDIVDSNPSVGLGKKLGLKRLSRTKIIKPFTEEELCHLLEVAEKLQPSRMANRSTATERDYPVLLTMARTGIRINESLALQLPDLSFDQKLIRIERIFVGAHIDTPKTEGSVRYVDMSLELKEVLGDLVRRRKEEKLRFGWHEMPIWVFVGPEGRPMRDKSVQRRFKRILEAAGLPLYHTPHDLRHTFACLHLKNGVNPVYVQHQLGHASIQMTVDLYGHWFRLSDHGAADRLDRAGFGKQKDLFEKKC